MQKPLRFGWWAPLSGAKWVCALVVTLYTLTCSSNSSAVQGLASLKRSLLHEASSSLQLIPASFLHLSLERVWKTICSKTCSRQSPPMADCCYPMSALVCPKKCRGYYLTRTSDILLYITYFMTYQSYTRLELAHMEK